MATTAAPTVQRSAAASDSEPLLEPGDWPSRAKFERRYERMPNQKKTQLIGDSRWILKSHVFPGIELDSQALLKGNKKTVLATLPQGLNSEEHTAFA